MANRVCMYCKKILGTDPRLEMDSHGICNSCLPRWQAQIERLRGETGEDNDRGTAARGAGDHLRLDPAT